MADAAASSSSGGGGPTPNPNDPSSFLPAQPNAQPTTLVKIQNTARQDVNGQIGYAVSYDANRGRYLVALPVVAPSTAGGGGAASGGGVQTQTLSLKPENLVRAGLLDKVKFHATVAKSQLSATLQNPQLREQTRRMYTSLDRRLPPAIKPEHVAGALAVVYLLAIRYVGFTKVMLLTSLLMLIPTVCLQDILSGDIYHETPRRFVTETFPRRWREALIRATGYEGISQSVAVGILGVVLALSIKILLTPTAVAGVAREAAAARAARSAASSMRDAAAAAGGAAGGAGGRGLATDGGVGGSGGEGGGGRGGGGELLDVMAQYYQLGYDDAQANRDYGASLPSDPPTIAASSSEMHYPTYSGSSDTYHHPTRSAGGNEWAYDPPPPSATTRSNKFGIGTLLSLSALYRFGKDLVMMPDGRYNFDVNFIMTKVRTMEPWRLGLLALSLYRVVTALLF